MPKYIPPKEYWVRVGILFYARNDTNAQAIAAHFVRAIDNLYGGVTEDSLMEIKKSGIRIIREA